MNLQKWYPKKERKNSESFLLKGKHTKLLNCRNQTEIKTRAKMKN